MGFLGSFNPVKIVSNIVKNPIQALPKAIVSGGASLVSPQISKALDPLTSTLYNPQLLPVAASLATGAPMGFNIGGFLGGVGQVLSGSQVSGIAGLGQIATALAPGFAQPQAMPVGQQQQTLPGVPRTNVQVMTKEIFDAASKLLGRLGIQPKTVGAFMNAVNRVMRSLAAMARRTPAGTIINLLIGLALTAQEANLLFTWWATKEVARRRRRMNPGNARALRRAIRRVKSFSRLAARSSMSISRTPSFRRARRRTRVVICPTCRRDPCQC